ncbi:MAG: hypothetical protein QM503_14615 [Bacteroidota bacterium]
MTQETNSPELFKLIAEKSALKTQVYNNTFKAFGIVKNVIENLSNDYQQFQIKNEAATTFVTKTRGKFELDLKFGGDILLFVMHTNVFEFPRHHEVMRTSYIKEDTSRSYCGIINIYNFIADSFKFNRVNDIGYLIGRIFVNKENHYFIEGKRELGFIYNNFRVNEINNTSMETIIKTAIEYTVNFDLLTPPYELVKYVSVNEMKSTLDSISVKTGKRLGYKFQADVVKSKE